MSSKSRIEWTDATWNPVVGCTPVSPGCAHCYAARMASRFPKLYGDVARGGKWTGAAQLDHERLDQPLRWRKQRRVFVCSMSDLFHVAVPFEFIASVFKVMAACPQHAFQVLTKRPERMNDFLGYIDSNIGRVMDGRPMLDGGDFGYDSVAIQLRTRKNVWLGTSCENQQTADERIPNLLHCPAEVRFLSIEPMLEPVDLSAFLGGEYVGLPGDVSVPNYNAGIGWVIVGGESGPGARPMQAEWVRSIRDQCLAAGVPFFFKQWGEFAPQENLQHINKTTMMRDGMYRVGRRASGHMLDGREWRQWPEVRQ